MLSVVTIAVLSLTPACAIEVERWRPVGLSPPCVVLAVPERQRVAAARKAWGLGEEAAKCAVAAAAAPDPGLDGPRPFRNPWLRCVERWPGEVALWPGAAEAQPWNPARSHHDWDLALAGLAKREDAADVARRLLTLPFGPELELARLVVERAPGDEVAAFERLGLSRETVLTLGLPLIEAASFRPAPSPCSGLASVGQRVLVAALQGDELQLAAEAWRQLPTCARDGAVARGLWTPREPVGGGRAPDRDLRVELALALLADGQLEAARKLGRALPPETADDQVLERAVLALHVEGRRTLDSWEAGVLLKQERRLPAEALGVLLPLLAPNEGFARKALAWARSDRAVAPREDQAPSLAARRATAWGRVQARLRSLPKLGEAAVAAVGPVRPVDAATVFREVKAPAGAKRLAPAAVKGLPDVAKLIPEGFRLVRAERAGGRTVVLATAPRLDPSSEASTGGYWLLLSPGDAGGWETLYLGLRERWPFVATAVSAVPLLDGDVVRVDVDEAPPPQARAEVVRERVVLEAPLAALRLDSDGDGLTDLVEARLMLDPAKRDTDGDGLADADDPAPRLDDRLAATPRGEVLNAFLAFMEGDEAGRTPRTSGPVGCGRGVVSYLVGTPAELGGLRPQRCLITLSPEEYVAARAAFGAFSPRGLDVIVSPDGQKAWIDWSERRRGGAVSAVRDAKGRWVLREESSWRA